MMSALFCAKHVPKACLRVESMCRRNPCTAFITLNVRTLNTLSGSHSGYNLKKVSCPAVTLRTQTREKLSELLTEPVSSISNIGQRPFSTAPTGRTFTVVSFYKLGHLGNPCHLVDILRENLEQLQVC